MERFHNVYRASLTQAILCGILSFTQPGVWTALTNLGAGGLQTVTTAYTANSITYGLMTILAPLTAFSINRYGIRPVLFVGSLGYIFYSAGLYLNSKTGSQVLVLIGAVTCGISAGPLWQAEGFLVVAYPEAHRRGLFIGIWQALNKVGSIIAGSIMVALNSKDKAAGKVSLTTYIFLLAIQATGPIWALMISSPKKVIRTDSTEVADNRTSESIKVMWKKLVKVATKKEILCLAPLMLTNTWYRTWQGNYTVHNFSVRARSLNVLLTAVISAIADLVGGWFLDNKRVSDRMKARSFWVFFALFFSFYFIWAFIVQGHIQRNSLHDLDWSGCPYFVKAYVPFQIFKIPTELIFNWIFWIVGLYGFSTADTVYVVAVIRGLESLGGVLSYVVGVVEKSDTVNLGIAAGMFWAVVPLATYVAWTVPEDTQTTESQNTEIGFTFGNSNNSDTEKNPPAILVLQKVVTRESE